MKPVSIVFCFIILFCSCAREQFTNNGERTYDCFSVEIESQSITKVDLDKSGNVEWKVGDCIGIYSDLESPKPYYRSEDGYFYGEKITGNTFYAYYPYYRFSITESNPSVLKYEISFGTYSGKYIDLPMIAKGADNHLVFKQTCGLLHFKVKWPETIKQIELSGRNDEIISGLCSIDLSEDTPVLKSESTDSNDKTNSVWFMGDVVNDSEDGFWHCYFILPEMELSSGFNLAIAQTGDEYVIQRFQKFTKKPVKISRGKMLTYSIDYDSEVSDEILQLERESLIALYNALDGDNWLHNDGWCTERPVGEWYGVQTNTIGRVVRLSLDDNRLRGEIPEEIGNLKDLLFLSLSNSSFDESTSNQLYGKIPERIGELTKLEQLSFTPHRFSGTIPQSLWNLDNLQVISLSGDHAVDENGVAYSLSQLEGVLPNHIGNLKHLRVLQLSNNKLTGEVPESISELSRLHELFINGNEFSGNLPDISNLSNITGINLSGNYFTGTIPSGYANLLDNAPDIFSVRFNQLSGKIPDEILSHPLFPEYTYQLLRNQKEGYKLELDESAVPACRHVFESFDGNMVNLGELYEKDGYTMIVRWAEWCPSAYQFTPLALSLANKYKDHGLQTVWAYAGGEEGARNEYMSEIGLRYDATHIIECYQSGSFIIGPDSKDHAVWRGGMGYGTPFVEIVNREGNIVFIDDCDYNNGIEYRYFDQYSFSHKRSELESFLINLLHPELYSSTDYSADGNVHTLQAATLGQGVNVVLMGDAFSDRLIADGTYKDVMEKAAEALFSEEPYKSHKDYFNVYYIDVVSKNEEYYGETALSTWYGNGTAVGGDDEKVFQYASTVLSDEQLDDALLIVMMNRDFYAGTCYMYYRYSGDYGSGASVSYFPTSSDTATFNGLVSHEAGGHGFAKLADEYAYEYMGAMPESEINQRNASVPYGWWKNADFTGDPLEVKWAQFIADNRYANENIACYEGAFTYWTGAWRPTDASIMRYNTGGFNAPSRYAIWYRIHKLAYGDEWQGTYEDFVEYDKVNRTPAAVARRKQQRRNFVEKDFEPLAPPVIINQDWRDFLRSRP